MATFTIRLPKRKYAVRAYVGKGYTERSRHFFRTFAKETATRMNGWPTFGYEWVVVDLDKDV